MKDRIPGAPGRYRANLPVGEFRKMQAGEPFAITLTRNDAPIVEGTPYSKAAVLPDDLAEKLCPGKADPSPADAFSALERTKAPAGYGLGTGSTAKAVTDITANGWYVTKEDTPGGYWYICHAFVTNNGNDVTVEAWHLDGTKKYKRTKRSGVWGEWQEMANAIGAYSAIKKQLESENLDEYYGSDKSGIYWCSKNCARAPFPSYFVLEVIGSFQRATRYLVDEKGILHNAAVVCRFYLNGEWSNWKEPHVSVEAAGTSGSWTYRKWSNGIAECWSKQTVTSNKNIQLSFPFLFAEEPSITISANKLPVNCFITTQLDISYSEPALSSYFDICTGVIKIFIVEGDAPESTVSLYQGDANCNIYCIGKWK